MRNNTFCHLHIHDQYSQLDGFGTAERYVSKAKELGFDYIGLTNHGNVDGLIEWQKACDKQGVKPVLGCEAYIVSDMRVKQKGEGRHHITLLVKNEMGWRNLLQMLTKANTKGFYHRPRIDPTLLLEHVEGLVVMSACIQTFLVASYGPKLLVQLQDTLPDGDIYLEVMPHWELERQSEINDLMYDISLREGLKLVATNDCHYVEEGEWRDQEVLLAIQRKAKWTDPDRWKFSFKGLHLRTADEMMGAFEKQGVLTRFTYLKAMRNSLEVAQKCCDFRIQKRDISLPWVSSLPESTTEDQYLWDFCRQGVKRKFGGEEGGWSQEYQDRLEEEFNLIKVKNFSRYFLICWELVNWCKENDILIGPGRGSVGGSLIAYLLGITTVDPIKYGLLFSRFISEDRIDYPDIDIDFQMDKRHLVRQHLQDLYGKDNVAGISTFLRMKTKAVVRDVARVFDTPLKDVNEFLKKVSSVDPDNKLEKALKESREGRSFQKKHPDVAAVAVKLEGQVRGAGQHPSGVIVSAEPLTSGERANLVLREDTSVINWDGDDAEYVGLMKLDILALNLLSVLDMTRKLVEENHEVSLDFEGIPLDDERVFGEISEGNTVGAFQLSGYTCTNLCKEMGVDNFMEMAHVISLARPGPSDSGMTSEYIRRKKGKKWKPGHPVFEEITQDTYGIVVYQEQVMEVINRIGGLPYSTADKIRKVIGKKRDAKEFKPFKDAFVEGCLKNQTFTEKEALDFWEMLQAHAHYSFNRSHAVEYAMLAYWTMWLKVHYPTEFICASLTFGAEGKKDELVREVYRMGRSVCLPKVGFSDPLCWTVREGQLCVPFIEVKGLGEKTAEKAAKGVAVVGGNTSSGRKIRGFFSKGPTVPTTSSNNRGGNMDKILRDIGAFDEDSFPAETAAPYFSFKISNNPEVNYPKLFKMSGVVSEALLKGRAKVPGVVEKRRYVNEMLLKCKKCNLSGQCSSPVLPSRGLYNIMICGEAPGKDEDEKGKGFVGRAGVDVLWPELARYGCKRRWFHVTNVVKCWPSDSKTPTKRHINSCWPWLEEEIERTSSHIILAFGNTCLKAFNDQDSGIMEKSGTTEWNEKVGAWICWSIHPAAVLHNASNRGGFEDGVRNFVETIKLVDGLDEIMF